jgi:capsular polysaccharide biosynthesis protein
VDLVQISRKVWLHRFVALPVIALTLIAAFYVVAVKKPTYEVSSSYVLINPPDPPSADEIARHPQLRNIGANNPYTRFADQSAMIGLLASRMGTESTRQELAAKGADPGYTVAPSTDIGYGSYLLEITGVGHSPETAVKTAQLVGTELTSQLRGMQAAQGVSPHYMIQAQNVVSPDHAKQKVSGKLRPLIGVLVIGAILLFIVISGAEALAAIRSEWSEAKRREAKGAAEPDHRAGPPESGEAPARETRRRERHRMQGRRDNGRKPSRQTVMRENGGELARSENGREPARNGNGRDPVRNAAENNSRSGKRRRRPRAKGTGSKA